MVFVEIVLLGASLVDRIVFCLMKMVRGFCLYSLTPGMGNICRLKFLWPIRSWLLSWDRLNLVAFVWHDISLMWICQVDFG